MSDFPFTLTDRNAGRAVMGLVVLQADETLEDDVRHLFAADRTTQYVTRVPSALEVSGDTLMEMREKLPAAAGLFPRAASFDVVGYGCTSGSAVIGADRVAELVKSACETKHVTNPLSALIAVCRHLDLTRIALLSPYVESVSDRLREALAEAGISTPVFGSFGEAEEAKVVRIDRDSVLAAAIELGRASQAQALFLSCTNLHTLDVIEEVEAAIGKPVLSSNIVLAWHMCQLAGVAPASSGPGRLLRQVTAA